MMIDSIFINTKILILKTKNKIGIKMMHEDSILNRNISEKIRSFIFLCVIFPIKEVMTFQMILHFLLNRKIDSCIYIFINCSAKVEV